MLAIREDELNRITGGDMFDTDADCYALYLKGYMREYYDVFDLMFDWVELSKRVDNGWGRAGVVCVSKPFKSNEYIRNGKEITRKEALQHIGF